MTKRYDPCSNYDSGTNILEKSDGNFVHYPDYEKVVNALLLWVHFFDQRNSIDDNQIVGGRTEYSMYVSTHQLLEKLGEI